MTFGRTILLILLAAISRHAHVVTSFAMVPTVSSRYHASQSLNLLYSTNDNNDLKNEAAELLEKARQLRQSLPAEQTTKLTTNSAVSNKKETSRWNVPDSNNQGNEYRLCVDIGRDEGTWMDPRWGASGKRIEFTLDVKFLLDEEANETVVNRMVKDNFGGTSSPVFVLETAPLARLRSGFDEMACHGGGYRIDTGRNGAATVRFHILVDGTPESGSSYGDVFVPKGSLYFSLPCFGSSISQISAKEGPLTVRQVGWHTGWRREESRMVGTFRAVPIEQARARDGF